MINKKGQIYCIDFIKDFKSATSNSKRIKSTNSVLLPNSTDLDNQAADSSLLIKEDENENIRKSRAASNILDTVRQQNCTTDVIIEDIDNENEDERLLSG